MGGRPETCERFGCADSEGNGLPASPLESVLKTGVRLPYSHRQSLAQAAIPVQFARVACWSEQLRTLATYQSARLIYKT